MFFFTHSVEVIYQSVVRPVLEYLCPSWHSSLTKEQTKQLEDVQRRALQVIFGNIQYDEVRCTYNVSSLAERRFQLCRTFFSEDHKRQVERPLVSFANQA